MSLFIVWLLRVTYFTKKYLNLFPPCPFYEILLKLIGRVIRISVPLKVCIRKKKDNISAHLVFECACVKNFFTNLLRVNCSKPPHLWLGYSFTTAFAKNHKSPPILRQVSNKFHWFETEPRLSTKLTGWTHMSGQRGISTWTIRNQVPVTFKKRAIGSLLI
jgi:hypothetical protein